MPQRILGLDIGSYSVKVAEVTRGIKSFELVHFYEKPVQYNDVLTPEQSLTAAIQAVLEDNNLTWDEIICAMPGEKFATRLITMPFGNVKKIDQTVEFEIENYIPFDLEDVVFDYNASIINKNLSKIMIAYANKGEFVKYLTLLSNAGVDPRVICAEGAELINLMHFGLVPPETSYAIIDIGHSKTTMTIGKGKKLILTRTIPIAGRHINEGIASKAHLPIDEAARLKVEIGHISIEETEDVDALTKSVNTAAKEVIDELMVHIRQTFFAYKDDEGEAVSGIYLSGGTSRMPGLDQYFSYKLRQNVTFLDPTSFHFSKIDRTEVHPAVVVLALSLALRGVSMGRGVGINFRSGEFAYRVSGRKLGTSSRKAAVLSGIVILLGTIYFGVQYYSLRNKTRLLTEDIAKLVSQATDLKPTDITSVADAVSVIERKERETREKMRKLDEELGVSVLDVLRAISVSLPGRDKLKVDIYEFKLSGDTVTMKGITDSPASVDKIQKELENSKEKKTMFRDVKTGGVNKVKEGYKFDVTMQIVNEGSATEKY